MTECDGCVALKAEVARLTRRIENGRTALDRIWSESEAIDPQDPKFWAILAGARAALTLPAMMEAP